MPNLCFDWKGLKGEEFCVGIDCDHADQGFSDLAILTPTYSNVCVTIYLSIMALTRDFKGTILARAARDPLFRKELIREGIESMLGGDIATAKTILRDYINATVGFIELAEATKIPSKSLMRMLGPRGNPRADNLFAVVSFLQRREGVRFRVRPAPR